MTRIEPGPVPNPGTSTTDLGCAARCGWLMSSEGTQLKASTGSRSSRSASNLPRGCSGSKEIGLKGCHSPATF